MIRNKVGASAVFLAIVDDNKVTLIAGVSKDAVKNGVKAGDLLEEIAPWWAVAAAADPAWPGAGEMIQRSYWPQSVTDHPISKDCPMGLTGSCPVTRVRARLRGRAVGSSSGS